MIKFQNMICYIVNQHMWYNNTTLFFVFLLAYKQHYIIFLLFFLLAYKQHYISFY